MREKNLFVFVTEIYGDELDNKFYSTLKANNFKLLIHTVHWKDSAEMYPKANKRKNTKQTELLYECLHKFCVPQLWEHSIT